MIRISGKEIKGAVFDVDGTLLDSVEAWMSVSSRYVRSLGMEPEPDLDQLLYSMSMDDGAVWLAEHYRIKKTPGQIIEEIDAMLLAYYRETVPLRDGARELLEWLQREGVGIVAATATDRPLIEGAFARLDIRRYFQEIFTCSQVGASKRQPLIYDHAAAALGTAPEETLVFEDALFALTTAKNAGFLTAGIYERHSDPEQPLMRERADVYARSLPEMMEKIADTLFRGEKNR